MAIGTPYFAAREIPCDMCEEVPCVKACPTATTVGVTHLRNREGKQLDNVSLQRHFCTQCHVPQTDAKPLADNTFQRARDMQ